MVEQPSGTVTLVFTDIEGSTRLLHELGQDGYREALAEHRRVVREAFQCGYEVDYEGDAFFYAFSSPADALEAVETAVEGLAKGPVRIRVGVHTGEPGLDPPKYVGRDVHLAARVMSVGHGGQVLISRATRDVVDVGLKDLGEHRLKDIQDPVWLYQLGEGDFPPLKSLNNTNLPRPASSFLGREADLDKAAHALAGCRLLTVSGPGGAGKTRFAIELASRQLPRFPNGVFWVPVAALRDPGLVVETIAQTVGAKNGLAEHIGERRMLLLLDNLEQVIDAAPRLSQLLTVCSQLSMVVTSRELLRVQGEVEFSLPPLNAGEAVQLFCERAHCDPDPTVEQLARKLEGLPLAIELAAARMSVFTPAQLLDRLSQRLDLLKGRRDADPRQQTLRATIQWSYELLTPEEAGVFRELAVFAGGCTLESAEWVTGADPDILQGLVEKSLVRRTDGRFWMLETIREFARERLSESGGAGLAESRHAEYYTSLAEGIANEALDSDDTAALEPESDNFRAALAFAQRTGEGEIMLRLAAVLADFWSQHGQLSEGRAWLESALALSEGPARARLRALYGLSFLACDQGDVDALTMYAEATTSFARAHDDVEGLRHGLFMLGNAAMLSGDLDRARAFFEESGNYARRTNSARGLAGVASALGNVAFLKGDTERALRFFTEAVTIRRSQEGARNQIGAALHGAAGAAFRLRLLDQCSEHLREAMLIFDELGTTDCLFNSFALAAALGLTRGKPQQAAQLLGRSQALADECGYVRDPIEQAIADDALHQLQEALGDQAAATMASGRNLSIHDAVTLAISII